MTEWGIAYLFGKSIRERILQLINVAHPDFREELLEYAKKCKYVFSDQILPKSVDGRLSLYPEKYETILTLKNEKTLKIRPVKLSDERLLQELYYSLGKHDRYLRFFTFKKAFRHKEIKALVNIDYTTKMILVGEYFESGKHQIVASAAIMKTNAPSTVEFAFVVNEEWRRNGIAKFLMGYLIKIARELNYKYFSGTLLHGNAPVRTLVDNSGYPIKYQRGDPGESSFIIDISKLKE